MNHVSTCQANSDRGRLRRSAGVSGRSRAAPCVSASASATRWRTSSAAVSSGTCSRHRAAANAATARRTAGGSAANGTSPASRTAWASTYISRSASASLLTVGGPPQARGSGVARRSAWSNESPRIGRENVTLALACRSSFEQSTSRRSPAVSGARDAGPQEESPAAERGPVVGDPDLRPWVVERRSPPPVPVSARFRTRGWRSVSHAAHSGGAGPDRTARPGALHGSR